MTNRFKNAAPSEEVEGTFYQIKCEKCGFKDATTDKSTWKCPECEIAVKNVVVVQPEKPQVNVAPQVINETKAAQHAAEREVEKSDFMSAFHKVLGTEPAKPAEVKETFKVGGFQCKIVTTKRQ